MSDEVSPSWAWLRDNTVIARDGSIRLKTAKSGKMTMDKACDALIAAGLPDLRKSEWEGFAPFRLKCEAEHREEVQAIRRDGYSDVEDFVLAKWNDWGVDIESRKDMTWDSDHALGRVSVTIAQLESRLKLELARYNDSRPVDPDTGKAIGPQLSRELVKDAIRVVRNRHREVRTGQLREALSYDATIGREWLEGWVRRLFSAYGIDPKPENVRMFCHLLYQVKCGAMHRHFDGIRILFSVFSRFQGIGKTEMLKRLCLPFLDAYREGSLSDLYNKDNRKSLFEGMALIDFAELALPRDMTNPDGSIDVASLSELKKHLTSPYVGGRAMYAGEDETMRQYACLCTSTNHHIFDVLYDDTGMRRYWEFAIVPPEGKTRAAIHEEANACYAEMAQVYRSIDENNEHGYYYVGCPLHAEIEAEQERYRRNNALDMFLEEQDMELRNAGDDGATKLPMGTFLSRINRWLANNREREWSMARLDRRLASGDIHSIRWVSPEGRHEHYVYSISRKKATTIGGLE